jgi:PAS domain S-box-containing protein
MRGNGPATLADPENSSVKAREAPIRINSAVYRQLVESVKDYAIFLLDPHGHVATWNPGAERMKGYSADEIIGEHFARFYPPEDIAAHKPERELEIAAREGRIEDEGWRLRKDGTRFWANVVISAVRDASGALIGFSKVTRDQTERLRGEEAARQLAEEQAARRVADQAQHDLQDHARRLERAVARTERLQSITAALAEARSPVQIGEIILEQGLTIFGAFSGLVSTVSADGNHLDLVAARGYEGTHRNSIQSIPLTARLPITETLRAGQARFWESPQQIAADFPDAPPGSPTSGAEAVIILPLRGKTPVAGAIALRFSDRRHFPEEDRAFAKAVALQCIQALDRVFLAERERQAIERAEFLAKAASILASSLDVDKVLDHLARLAVPSLGDWCAIQMSEGDKLGQAAVAHSDPAKIRWAREMEKRYPTDPTQRQGVPEVIRSGKPEIYAEITDEMISASARDPDHLRVLREMGLRSALIVPLIASGRPMGALSLIRAGSGRGYDQTDLDFAMELAHRAALSVENARLFKDLRTAVVVRDEFLSIAGHEINTPLAAIKMHVQGVIRLAARDPGAERVRERLEKAAASCTRLERLILQLLDVSRITAGRLRLDVEEVDLTHVISDAARRFADVAARAECPMTLDLQEDVRGEWDAVRLDQVVTNLLSNAFKYGKGHPVEVELTNDGTSARLSVRDHGIGIPTDQQARIFERFERAVGTREFGGFGLGLWITRRIVDASGGRIEVDSVPGHGATFIVTLPLIAPMENSKPQDLHGSP